MAAEDVFDVIVIGAGPAGEVAAGRAVRGGLFGGHRREALGGRRV